MLNQARTVKTAISAAVLALAFAPAAHAGLTGHVDVVSKYILRGITSTYNPTYDGSGPESDGPAVQGGLDFTTDGGFYVGYWFSTLGYSYDACCNPNASAQDARNSTEHDFYAGYNGKAGGLGYTVGGTIYYYDPGYESLGFETKLGLTAGDFGFTAQTLLNDVTYGNAGDTYFVASYTKALPKDFTFAGQLGAYYYTEDGDFITNSTDTFSFRHLTVGITHPIGTTGATWGLQYIIGGDNRFSVKQSNQLVGSLVVAF